MHCINALKGCKRKMVNGEVYRQCVRTIVFPFSLVSITIIFLFVDSNGHKLYVKEEFERLIDWEVDF